MSSSAYQDRPAAAASISSRGTKRPRRQRTSAAVAAAAPWEDASPWASLHGDLISLIAWRVLAGDFHDYVRFRAACRHWRSSTDCPRGRGISDRRFHPRRWMLFPEGHGLHPGHGKLRGHVRFFNLSTGAFVRVRLPIFRDHCVLDSVDGILLLQRDHDTAVRLLHPFTGDIAEFPPFQTLLRLLGDEWYYFRSIGAASINVSADGVISLMIMGSLVLTPSNVFFATSGDQQWRVTSWYLNQKFSPLAFQGKLYVVCNSGTLSGGREVLQIDPPQLEGTKEPWVPSPRSIAKCPVSSKPHDPRVYYLVERGSEILVVARSCGKPMTISAYRLADLMLGRNVLVTGIGGDALFIGYTRNLCISSKAFPTIVSDTIVFYHGEECSLDLYHLSRGTLLPASDATIRCDIPSPCSIIYHIYTCCYRQLWNKGQIKFQGEERDWRVKRKWRTGA